MAGVKGRSGGPRPGSGRKRKETVVEQASRRDGVLMVFHDAAWIDLLKSWLVLGRTAPHVIYPLLPYILGGVKQEIDVNARVEHVQMEAARTVLRVVGGTEKRAS